MAEVTLQVESPEGGAERPPVNDGEEAEDPETDAPWGCLYPGECCEAVGSHLKLNRDSALEVWLAARH